jgi:hypothetical protein
LITTSPDSPGNSTKLRKSRALEPTRLDPSQNQKARAATPKAKGATVDVERSAQVKAKATTLTQRIKTARLVNAPLHQSLIDAADSALTVSEQTEALRRRLTAATVDRVLSGTQWLSAAQIGEIRASGKSNPHSALARWLANGRVFALERHGARIYPAYAFDELGEPLPIMTEVLRVFAGFAPFRIAAWFESPNVHLHGARPREQIPTRGLEVLKAAHEHVTGLVHG